MNQENFEQVTVSKDVIGDQAQWLQENMVCILSMFNGNAVAIQLPARVTLEITETEPAMKGQTGVVVLQAGQAQQRRPRDGAAAHPAGHARRDPDGRWGLCGAREGLRRGETRGGRSPQKIFDAGRITEPILVEREPPRNQTPWSGPPGCAVGRFVFGDA